MDAPFWDAQADVEWSVIERIALTLHASTNNLEQALRAIVDAAVDAFPAAEHAGLILVVGKELVPVATRGLPPEILDAWQHEHGEGPCITSAVERRLVRLTVGEGTWPEFEACAEKVGVCDMLCVPLWLEGTQLGALSLYSSSVDGFSGQEGRASTEAFACLAALALDDAKRLQQFKNALENRDLIGQAKGMLMERHGVDADTAFKMLRRLSQRTNQKLNAVAATVARTGDLSPLGSPADLLGANEP